MSEKIIVNYKYALRPNKQQSSMLWNTLQGCRKLYNESLELWQECWQESKIGLDSFILNRHFKDNHFIARCANFR